MEIRGGMHGLSQARQLAHNELVAYLASYGYSSIKFIPSLQTHNTLKTIFTLVVNDFRIKHLSIQDIRFPGV